MTGYAGSRDYERPRSPKTPNRSTHPTEKQDSDPLGTDSDHLFASSVHRIRNESVGVCNERVGVLFFSGTGVPRHMIDHAGFRGEVHHPKARCQTYVNINFLEKANFQFLIEKTGTECEGKAVNKNGNQMILIHFFLLFYKKVVREVAIYQN